MDDFRTRRSALSQLKAVFPAFEFADNLDEDDVLWDPEDIESEEVLSTRVGIALEECIDLSESCRCESRLSTANVS